MLILSIFIMSFYYFLVKKFSLVFLFFLKITIFAA